MARKIRQKQIETSNKPKLPGFTPNFIINKSFDNVKTALDNLAKVFEDDGEYEIGNYGPKFDIEVAEVECDKELNDLEIEIMRNYLIYIGWSDVDIAAGTYSFDITLSKDKKSVDKMIADVLKDNEQKNMKFITIEEFIQKYYLHKAGIESDECDIEDDNVDVSLPF